MSNLHAYFALRNQQGFSKALDGSRSQANSQVYGLTLSSSGGKTWARTSAIIPTQGIDVNARDWLGRTVLHIACATIEPFALTFIRLLLAHPNINVNLQDTESHWTALHRSLYVGNVAASQLLLQCSDIDVQLRDYEGLTPFDLYNLTIDDSRPTQPGLDTLGGDLFTWGGNRNAVLGHGDSDNRTYPDQVVIQSPEPLDNSSSAKFTPIQVTGISMAKLHTTIITDEKRANLRACGFGSGGRLGPGQHTQYSLMPVPQFTHRVTAVALGQDHTLALTSDGVVLSWGLNRFSQLGYVVETATPAGPLHTRAMDEPIQSVARKILGALKKENVIGVAACRTASACWTSTDVFTWGTNNGQLGYDSAAQPVQIQPRKVTGVQTVTDLVITDSAMVCLLETRDVICFKDDNHFRVKFPIPELSDFPPYVNPFVVRPPISKITSCDDVFGALSTRGDVFTFPVPSRSHENTTNKGGGSIVTTVKPQRVWSLRKSFDPATDIALGSDGDIILCTASGLVFMRSRNVKGSTGGKAFKFHRVPFIHRVIKVCANSTGAFAALRLNYNPKHVQVSGPSLTEDIRSMRPWLNFHQYLLPAPTFQYEDHDEDEAMKSNVMDSYNLCALLAAQKDSEKTEGRSLFHGRESLTHGADVFIHVGFDIPAHRVVLAARSQPLKDLIDGSIPVLRGQRITIKYQREGTGLPRLIVTGCHSMTILLVLEYLYSDDVLAIWDRRVGVPCSDYFVRLKVHPGQVKAELETLAQIMNLLSLSDALFATVKRVPSRTLCKDIECLFRHAEAPFNSSSAVRPDIFLELANRRVACHSVLLRARCPFFRSFFDDKDWTVNRWTSDGTLTVDMRHLEWIAMEFVMVWLYYGQDGRLFDHLDSVNSVQELLDLVFAVMAVASELLLDKLMLICSAVILRHVTLNNVAYVLSEATYYDALSLVESLQDYVTNNLEAIMESHLFDGMQPELIKSISTYVRHRQGDKSPIMRSNLIALTAMRKHAGWLELQDVPEPLVRTYRHVRNSPKLSPMAPDKPNPLRRPSGPFTSPSSSPTFGPTAKPSPPRTPKPSHEDGVFAMDDAPPDAIPVLNLGQPQPPPVNPSIPRPWQAKSLQGPVKVDMKTIMSEAATERTAMVASSSTQSRVIPVPLDNAEVSPTSHVLSRGKPSQRERRKGDVHRPLRPSEPLRRVLSSGSPWRLSSQQASTSAGSVPLSVRGTPMASPPAASTPIAGFRLSPEASVSMKQPATPMSVFDASNPSSLGPISTPTLVQRRTHADATAWINAPLLDPTPPTGLSFTAIQQQQRDQGQTPKGKRSLREIQDEERAKQEEEDFLKWWAAEEQRLKMESEMASDPHLSNIAAAQPSNTRQHGSRRGRRVTHGRRGN